MPEPTFKQPHNMATDLPQGHRGPLPISQYWNTTEVPLYIESLMATFKDRSPGIPHRVFDETTAERFIAEHFSPREVRAFQSCAIPAMQADYFRYCVVLSLGGIYADADYQCVANLEPLLDERDSGRVFCRPETYLLDGVPARRVLNGFFAFKHPGHSFLQLTLELATANLEARIAERVWKTGEMVRPAVWLTVGPGIFTLMHFLNLLGSFDRLIAVTTETPAAPFMDLFCEVVGSYERVAEACEDVRVSLFDDMWSWIAHPDEQLPYKQTDAYWRNAKTAIFK